MNKNTIKIEWYGNDTSEVLNAWVADWVEREFGTYFELNAEWKSRKHDETSFLRGLKNPDGYVYFAGAKGDY